MKLSTEPHLLQRLRIFGPIPLLPHISSGDWTGAESSNIPDYQMVPKLT
jgi:hypothetical protein